MRKILSTMLAVIMILCSFPGAFAEEEEYNSLKLPVINEVIEENAEEVELFGTQSSKATLYSGEDSVLTVTGIPMQRASKGSRLVIRSVTEYLSNAGEVIDFYNNCSEYSVLFEYERNGNTTLMFYGEQAFGNIYIDDDTEELIVPVPVELANGAYTVRVHQLNNIWDYRDGGYSELVFEFVLNVTDADETSTYYQSLNKINALNEDSFSMVEGDFGDRPEFTLVEELPGDAHMTGFAIDDNGKVYPISGYCDGRIIECQDEFNVLPAGRYDCYFYVADPYYDWDYWTSDLYGPLKLNIGGISFGSKYYSASSFEQWFSIEMGASVASQIPSDMQGGELSFKFLDEQGEVAHCIYEVPVTDVYIDSWEEEIYGGNIEFYMNLIGFDAGTYYASVSLADEDENVYELGWAEFTVTDKTVVESIYIMNDDGELTTATENFYVCVNMADMFVDCDKININLVDAEGNIVAETVSKELEDIYRGRTGMVFGMKVTGDLHETGWDSQYMLDILYDKELELISVSDNVYVRVTAESRVLRAELIGEDTVKIYTENLAPGKYKVVNYQNIYYVTIDEQGIGTFRLNNPGSQYYHFDLETADGQYIAEFYVRITDRDNFRSNPGFIAQQTKIIENFHVVPYSSLDRITVEDIEYARIVQNDETAATMTNLRIDGWMYYNSEPGIRLNLYGDLIAEAGFTCGEATFEIKYTDGTVYTHDIPVADETTGLYGSLNMDNSCYLNKGAGGADSVVGNSNVSFCIENTNAVTGTVSLYESDTEEALEVIRIEELLRTVKNDCYYTYEGVFNTIISSEKVYDIVFEANNRSMSFDRFTYYDGKLAECCSDGAIFDGEGYVQLENPINISNAEGLHFGVLTASDYYDIPVKEYYEEDGYMEFFLDFSSVPEGYFTLKAYDGEEEVTLTSGNICYNYVAVTEPFIEGTGWKWVGENKDTREYRIYGRKLDAAADAKIKLYKVVDFPESLNYYKEKLRYMTDITIDGPYNENYISVEPSLLPELESGSYTLLYVIDGKPAEAQRVYIGGQTPTPAVTCGDANGDGEVDFADAIVVLKHDAGVSPLTGDNLKAADTNGDGEADFADAILILKYDSGLISSFN